MNPEQKIAYEWAKSQSYQSVASRYAKTLAALIDSLTAQLTESQRREKAAVEDIARLVASTPDIKCSIVCDGDCLDCTGSATGTPRGYHYRGSQEAEKGEAE